MFPANVLHRSIAKPSKLDGRQRQDDASDNMAASDKVTASDKVATLHLPKTEALHRLNKSQLREILLSVYVPGFDKMDCDELRKRITGAFDDIARNDASQTEDSGTDVTDDMVMTNVKKIIDEHTEKLRGQLRAAEQRYKVAQDVIAALKRPTDPAQITREFCSRQHGNNAQVTVQVFVGQRRLNAATNVLVEDVWGVLQDRITGLEGQHKLEAAATYDSKIGAATCRFNGAEDLRRCLTRGHCDGDFLYVFLTPRYIISTVIEDQISNYKAMTASDAVDKFEGIVQSVHPVLERALFYKHGTPYATETAWESFFSRLQKGELRDGTSITVCLRNREGLGGLHHVHHS